MSWSYWRCIETGEVDERARSIANRIGQQNKLTILLLPVRGRNNNPPWH